MYRRDIRKPSQDAARHLPAIHWLFPRPREHARKQRQPKEEKGGGKKSPDDASQ